MELLNFLTALYITLIANNIVFIMRRITNNRSVKTFQPSSPVKNETIASFKKASCKRGHSLMRRTQLSWEKLQSKENAQGQQKNTNYNIQNNDYFVGRQQESRLKGGIRQNLKGGGNQKSRPKFYQRERLICKEKEREKKSGQVKYVGRQKQQNQEQSLRPKAEVKKENQISKVSSKKKFKNLRKRIKDKKQASMTETYEINKLKRKDTRLKQFMKQRKIKVQQFTIDKQQINETYQLKPYRIKEEKRVLTEETEEEHIQTFNKSKQQLSTMSELRHSGLPLESRKCSIISNIQCASNKITLHLEILGQLAEYSKELLEMYEDSSEWQQLVFLVYKKYFMERLKVARSLRGIGFNPFQLNVCSVPNEQLQSFRKKLEGIKLAKEVQAQNRAVSESLRTFYNLIIQKSGNHINLQQRNDFTQQIFKDMAIQIDLLKEIGGFEAEKRLGRVYRCAFLIAQLQGNPIINYEQSLDTDDFTSYLKKASKLFHQCLIL